MPQKRLSACSNGSQNNACCQAVNQNRQGRGFIVFSLAFYRRARSDVWDPGLYVMRITNENITLAGATAAKGRGGTYRWNYSLCLLPRETLVDYGPPYPSS